MSSRPSRGGLTSEQRLLAWQSVSLLLGYPNERLLGRLELVRSAAQRLPAAIQQPLHHFTRHLESTPHTQLQTEYVDTFDTRRRSNLFLTYFAHGDTRKRGMALLRFKQTYLSAGVTLDDSELPDHLCVVLEFAATVNQERGLELILEHRAGLELLRLSLGDQGSPWVSVLDALSATLPPLRGDEREAVRRLAMEGPPEEEVGLSPFANPQFSPGAPSSTPSGTVLLPTPTFPGVRA